MNKKSIQSKALAIATSVVLFPITGVVYAAELEEVIVTAQKREQRLVDVPMGVTALAGEALLAKGIDSVSDLTMSVPGMTIREDSAGSMALFLRGVGNMAGSSALVSMYLDETPISIDGARNLDIRALDIERVEVLKGPQGTLYGQGAVAGTVRYISKKPTHEKIEGHISTGVSSVASGDTAQKITAVYNAPIVDDVFTVRVAASLNRGGGWIDQPQAGIKDGNNQDVNHIRVKALWDVSDNFSLDATVAVHSLEARIPVSYEDENRNLPLGFRPETPLTPNNDKYKLYNLTAHYDFGFAELISSSSKIKLDQSYGGSYNAGSETAFANDASFGSSSRTSDSDLISQEIRLSSAGDGFMSWSLGVFYTDSETDFLSVGHQSYQGIVYPEYYVEEKSSETLSFFANTDFAITEKLTLGFGLRNFEDKQKYFDGQFHQSEKFTSTNERVFASYAMNEDWNVYMNYGTGFRSGGFNRGGSDLSYEPENLSNIEIGTKASLFDNSLSVEAAIYDSQYEDMLRRGLVVVNGFFVDVTSNIGQVDITGYELAANWQLSDSITLNFSGSWIDSEVAKLDLKQGEFSVSQVGDPADYVADYSYSIGLSKSFQWATDVSGNARLDYNYRDAVSVTDNFLYQTEFRTQYTDNIRLLNLRVSASFDNGIAAEFFVKNLNNENLLADPFDQYGNANRTKPRTIGLNVSYNF